MKRPLIFFLFSLFSQVNLFAQAPNISYSTPQTYVTGTAITPITPINTGGTITYGKVTTFAGNGANGSSNGTGTSASFYSPLGVAVDASGNVYVADYNNKKIRKITSSGVVTTLAGSGTFSSIDGTGTSASFYALRGITVDTSGNVYVTEDTKIRKITPAGVVTTLALTGANFSELRGITVDASGNIYVVDSRVIKKVTPAGVVTILAGNGTSGSKDGIGTVASFNIPRDIAVDTSGNIYVADTSNFKIRKITPSGFVSTVAGSGTNSSIDGTGTSASFTAPNAIAVDASGNVYVTDSDKIRKITPTSVVSTLAGNGIAGSTDGTGTTASFNSPLGIALDASGDVYVADKYNNKIRKVTTGGYAITPQLPSGLSLDAITGIISGEPSVVTPQTAYTITATNSYGSSSFNLSINTIGAKPIITYATPQIYSTGTAITPLMPTNTGGIVTYGSVTTLAGSGTSGTEDEIGTIARFNNPYGVAVDASNNIYVADYYNNKIRKVTSAGVVTTLAGSGASASIDGTGTSASFDYPFGVAVDKLGNVFVIEENSTLIRKITPAGVVTTFAGGGSGGDSAGTSATFGNPNGIAVDASGNVYVADSNKIRKISPMAVVSTLAGNGTAGSIDGTGTTASFNSPRGVAVDASGNVYVTESNKIRKITPAGVVSTLSGIFSYLTGIVVTASGNIYVTDSNEIKKITPEGVVTSLAGSATKGSADGIGIVASFDNPRGVALDASGNLYVADTWNDKIRKIDGKGGYDVSPKLPTGLTINSVTGIISGTPTVISPQTNYTITATNSYGNNNVTLSITVASARITLPTNNFNIVSKGESCLGENNGEISISATLTYPYKASINGLSYSFTNNSLTVPNLTPGTYNVSITIPGEIFEQSFTIVIPKATSISGKSNNISNKVSVEIQEGTAPYTVFVDGVEQFETFDTNFSIGVAKEGGLLEVKTAKACEGVYSKDIASLGISAFVVTNPTSGNFEIEVSTSKKEVFISLYTLNGQMISSNKYSVENGRAKLSLEGQTSGIYIAKIQLDTPCYLKIIKN